MENNRYDHHGQRYDEILAFVKAENIIENASSNTPEPDEPQKNIPGKPDIEKDPTRIEPGINEPVKNDPTRTDDLPPIFNKI